MHLPKFVFICTSKQPEYQMTRRTLWFVYVAVQGAKSHPQQKYHSHHCRKWSGGSSVRAVKETCQIELQWIHLFQQKLAARQMSLFS
jgi:hypothetical protein